ncbi:MAG TPA: fimbrial assembly protein [Paraburkholderia sp.]|jgi:type IV pilus assembly protein PilN|nr:fimbrial assembly protein [Paraburkholderia sp.]
MMRALFTPLSAGRLHACATAPARGLRARRLWLGGFNLLPYRQRNARLARRRCVLEWTGAALAGCVAVLIFAGWQGYEKKQFDDERTSIEQTLATLAAPLAEHAKLALAQDQQRQGVARAKRLSEPLVRLRDLLDALSFEPGEGVVLQQLRQRENETDLLATSRGHLASADWLKHLSTIRGVTSAEVSDLHRSGSREATASAMSANGPVEFGAHLRWGDPTQKTSVTDRATAPHPRQSEQTRGER